MIKVQTVLQVIDNSGAKKVKCIKVIGKGERGFARLGDRILVAIQSLRSNYKRQVKRKIKKGDVCEAVVVRTSRFCSLGNGKGLNLLGNAVALTTFSGKPLGNRIPAVLPRRLRRLKRAKFACMAKKIV